MRMIVSVYWNMSNREESLESFLSVAEDVAGCMIGYSFTS